MKHHFEKLEINDYVNVSLKGTQKFNKYQVYDKITLDNESIKLFLIEQSSGLNRMISSQCTTSRTVEKWTTEHQKGLIEQNRSSDAENMLSLMSQVKYESLSNDDLQNLQRILEANELL